MASDFPALESALSSLVASEKVKAVLRDLHIQALTETPYLSTDDQPPETALEKFVALEPEKCAFVYCMSSSLPWYIQHIHMTVRIYIYIRSPRPQTPKEEPCQEERVRIDQR